MLFRSALLLIVVVIALSLVEAGLLWIYWPYIQGSLIVAYTIIGVGIVYAIYYRIRWLPIIRGTTKNKE